MTSVGERMGLTRDPLFDVSELPEGLRVTRTSVFTGARNTMTLAIQPEDFLRWRRGGGLVQVVFPNLSPDEHEFLVSGATPEEWESVFGEEGEDE